MGHSFFSSGLKADVYQEGAALYKEDIINGVSDSFRPEFNGFSLNKIESPSWTQSDFDIRITGAVPEQGLLKFGIGAISYGTI